MDPRVDNRELRIEILEPWYFCTERPQVTSVRSISKLRSGIQSPTHVGVIGHDSVTHAFNSGQRYIVHDFDRTGSDALVRCPVHPLCLELCFIKCLLVGLSCNH
jgi:hypothetical protein